MLDLRRLVRIMLHSEVFGSHCTMLETLTKLARQLGNENEILSQQCCNRLHLELSSQRRPSLSFTQLP